MLDKKDLRGNAKLFQDVAQLLTEWADDIDATLAKKKTRKAAEVPGRAGCGRGECR